MEGCLAAILVADVVDNLNANPNRRLCKHSFIYKI